MPIEPTSTATANPTWVEIEDLVEQIAELAGSDIAPRDFHAALLDRAVTALAAIGGAIWSRGSGNDLTLEYQIHLARASLASSPVAESQHARLLDAVLRSGEPRLTPPRSGSADQGDAGNPTEHLLVLCPVVVDGRGVALIEVFQRAVNDPTTQRGYVQLLSALAELAADFHQRRQLRDLRDRQAIWDRLERFSRQVHGNLDVRPTTYTLANDGREVIGCDRVSVATVRGKRGRMRAISGVERLERRSGTVRLLERLISAVVASQEPLWYDGNAGNLPPQIDEPLHAYLDESHAKALAVLPLRAAAPETEEENDDSGKTSARERAVIAALVAEQFEVDSSDDSWRHRVEAVARHGEVALRNALDYERLPLLGLMKVLRRVAGLAAPPHRVRALTIVTAVAAAIAALILVPADFSIDGRGQLLPKSRRDVFAPANGDVRELLVEHGDLVDPETPGKDLLLVLRQPQLDFEASRVSGEMQTARKRLAAVQAARLGINRTGRDDPARYNELTAEEEELKEQLASLDQQAAILRVQQEELRVRAPMKGQVLTWDLDQLLAARPVQRGQTLLTVADVDGPWELELTIPDDQIGHVLEAQAASDRPLEVTFILATDPGVTYDGRIERVAFTTEEKQGAERPSVTVRVDFDASRIKGKRPGASAIAKVHCGRASLGYVWLHELFEAVQSRILF